MTREKKARYLTVAVIAAALVFVIGQMAGWQLPAALSSLRPPAAASATAAAPGQPSGPEPRDAIYKMLDAARAGDAAAYLACFSGQMEAALRQSQSEMGPPRFSQYLSDTNKEIKGIALSEPVSITDREVRVRVEYVYQGRNEAQQFYLEKLSGLWRISRIDSTERVKTLVPYGTPVY
ncbi:MAG TPA: hypothetical protein VEU62_02810 [Bryobacterales bacterium]|nr:hypothetical protein [Bryobacterales bacterium]